MLFPITPSYVGLVEFNMYSNMLFPLTSRLVEMILRSTFTCLLSHHRARDLTSHKRSDGN